ncbi:MAG TPA: ATPase [Ruminococcus sp.]|nr:ATPase [Ruminococcus sp.]
MNIRDAKNQIKNAVAAYLTKDELGRYVIPPHKQRPIFLMGPPGIGKTAIMEQVASELGIGLLSYSMTHHTRQSALGLPLIKQMEFEGKTYDISEYTMSEIIASVYEMMKNSGVQNGILFLDEINCVSETLTPIMLQFLQYKVFGRHEVPAGWIVVTAGNPPEYNRSVREFDIATWDRLKRVDVEPDFDAWKEYAYEIGTHSSIMTYLETKKNHFYRVSTTVDGKRFVTARGWDDLSQMIHIYEAKDIPVDNKLISQYLQDAEIARDFAIYYDLYNKYRSDYQIPSILAGQASAEIKNRAKRAKFDERYSLLGLLLESVMSEMKKTIEEDEILTELLVMLRQYKTVYQKDALGTFRSMIRSQETRYKNGMESRSLTDAQQIGITRLINILHEEEKAIQNHPQNDAFQVVKADFDARVGALMKMVKQTSGHVTNMFRFGDEVFPNGQELIILVTELTANPNCARFLGKYNIEEYFIHDKSLMFSQRQREILSQIEELKLD